MGLILMTEEDTPKISEEKAVEVVQAMLKMVKSVVPHTDKQSDPLMAKLDELQALLPTTLPVKQNYSREILDRQEPTEVRNVEYKPSTVSTLEETKDISPEKPAVKSHVTELPKTITVTSQGKERGHTGIRKPRKPFYQQSVATKARTSADPRKKSTKQKSAKGGRIKCKLCGYSAENIGALSKHRKKKHPNAASKSAKKAATTRKKKPKQATYSGGFNPDQFIQSALQRKRSTK